MVGDDLQAIARFISTREGDAGPPAVHLSYDGPEWVVDVSGAGHDLQVRGLTLAGTVHRAATALRATPAA
jgi:hypothetical protein